jgi:hypothetical protein
VTEEVTVGWFAFLVMWAEQRKSLPINKLMCDGSGHWFDRVVGEPSLSNPDDRAY